MTDTLTPTGDFDQQVKDLLRSLNKIDRAKDDWVSEAGHKMIKIRQLMESRNGKGRGIPGPDGLNPAGWMAWCALHGLKRSAVSMWIQKAADPEGYRTRYRANNDAQRIATPRVHIRKLRRAWPTWTPDQQQDFLDAVTSIATENANG